MIEETTPLIRPDWLHEEFHKESWRKRDVTAIMCERDTADVTKLCLESLLKFYPDLPLLIIDGGSTDGSLDYVRMLEKKYSNITVWHRIGRNGHGTMLDEGIRRYIRTKYVLLLDNDLIIKRGRWIEGMLDLMNFSAGSPYAVGSLMLVTNIGDACGEPKDADDVLRYIHPSCGMIHRETYLTMRPFVEHGAPLVYNMQDAQKKGLIVKNFAVEKYVCHLSGASWTQPRTVWRDDMDVLTRPFFTIIVDDNLPKVLEKIFGQQETDLEVIPEGKPFNETIHIFGIGQRKVENRYFDTRFHVHGEYVLLTSQMGELDWATLTAAKRELIRLNMPDEYEMNSIKYTKRKLWQEKSTL